MGKVAIQVILGLAVAAALPYESIIRKLDDGLRYQYMSDPDGVPHLVDLWGTPGDVAEAARYNPDTQNVYHLFTRKNPTLSQPLVFHHDQLLAASNFDSWRQTVILVHGWRDHATGDFNTVLVPALLSASNLNVIVVDWHAGAGTPNYLAAMRNTVSSGEATARFISWLVSSTGAQLSLFNIIGYSLGGQKVGIIGRNLGGEVGYITSLDPARPGWDLDNPDRFRSSDGVYTEVIHTVPGFYSYIDPVGDVDFYTTYSRVMPGCLTTYCGRDRVYRYMANSYLPGGIMGTKCKNYVDALKGQCDLPEFLPMGGLQPKTRASGIYHVDLR